MWGDRLEEKPLNYSIWRVHSGIDGELHMSWISEKRSGRSDFLGFCVGMSNCTNITLYKGDLRIFVDWNVCTLRHDSVSVVCSHTTTCVTCEKKKKKQFQQHSNSSWGSAAGSKCYKEIIMMYRFVPLHCYDWWSWLMAFNDDDNDEEGSGWWVIKMKDEPCSNLGPLRASAVLYDRACCCLCCNL